MYDEICLLLISEKQVNELHEKYIIKEFDPKTAEDEELYKVFRCLDILFDEKETDDPKPSDDFRMKNFRIVSPMTTEYWWLVWLNEQVIGYCVIYARTEKSPSYAESKHVAYLSIRIVKEHRRKGIGLEIMKRLVAKAKETEVVTTFQTNSSYDSGYAFSEKLNGILALESAENRCRISEIDWKIMKEWRDQGRKRGKEDGRTLQWFEVCPEEIIEEYCKVYTETMNQQPLGELEHKPNITPESRRVTEKNYKKLAYQWYTVIAREDNGKISGLTDVTYIPEQSYRLEQELTGVLVEFRGKGLGKWLKSEMLFFNTKNSQKSSI